MNLRDNENNDIIELIKQGRKLPKEYIYKLYQDDEDVFLFWLYIFFKSDRISSLVFILGGSYNW